MFRMAKATQPPPCRVSSSRLCCGSSFPAAEIFIKPITVSASLSQDLSLSLRIRCSKEDRIPCMATPPSRCQLKSAESGPNYDVVPCQCQGLLGGHKTVRSATPDLTPKEAILTDPASGLCKLIKHKVFEVSKKHSRRGASASTNHVFPVPRIPPRRLSILALDRLNFDNAKDW